jgi:S-methylmethionine-dependent homocysteine/selenocysteine methylase
MLNKLILEVEKKRNVFIDQIKLVENWSEKEIVHFLRKNFEKFVELEAKLSTLKKYQAKFDKFVEEIKQKVLTDWKGQNEFIDFIDKLSPKEGEE